MNASLLTVLFVIVYCGFWQGSCLVEFQGFEGNNYELTKNGPGQLFIETPPQQQIAPSMRLNEQRPGPQSSRQVNPITGALAPVVPRRQVCFCCRAYVCQYQRCPCNTKFFL